MNATCITLTVRPDDVDHFDFETQISSEKFPELSEIHVGDVVPAVLNDYADKPFVGFYGSHSGDYCAHLVACSGDGVVCTHPCDEEGRLVLGTDVFKLDDPMWIGSDTSKFIMIFRGVLQNMLDDTKKRK